MRRAVGLARLLVLAAAMAVAGLARAQPAPAADFVSIPAIVSQEIASGHVPGAVILIGDSRHDLFRQAFGQRVLGADPRPMTVDTIFDLASLTKVVATTTAVMQLSEAGRLDLDAPVAKYWPAFAANGKAAITLRDLLTHHSGLRADLDLSQPWSGHDTAMAMIVAEKPLYPAGSRYLYSDTNFEVLGELVRRVSGLPLDQYCREKIFQPLGMTDTGFLPPPGLHDRIAPTEDTQGHVHWGDVHDATARWMGGVAGHAGVFSTADDLAIFARMLLNHGELNGVRILSAGSVARMTRVEAPAIGHTRGFGWDLGGVLGDPNFPAGSYGHLGYTGTMIWIDPGRDLFAIVLTHRVYPDGTGDAGPLREAILGLLGKRPLSAAR
jgi:CubicO group peptidase (beta-lactamase class C family)